MKEATALLSFNDLIECVSRTSGDVFSCDDERGEQLAKLGLVRLKDVPEKKPRRKRITKG